MLTVVSLLDAIILQGVRDGESHASGLGCFLERHVQARLRAGLAPDVILMEPGWFHQNYRYPFGVSALSTTTLHPIAHDDVEGQCTALVLPIRQGAGGSVPSEGVDKHPLHHEARP